MTIWFTDVKILTIFYVFELSAFRPPGQSSTSEKKKEVQKIDNESYLLCGFKWNLEMEASVVFITSTDRMLDSIETRSSSRESLNTEMT